MKIEFDPDRNARNINLRGISFENAARFAMDTALVIQDARRDYREPRYRAFGTIDVRLHVLVFTPREGTVPVISLAKANHREVRRFERQPKSAAH